MAEKVPQHIRVPNDMCKQSNLDPTDVYVYSYLKTKFVRFLMLLCISGFGLSKIVFPFVPMQDFSKPWTDQELYEKYHLTEEEIAFIESLIKPMDQDGENDGD